MNKGILVGIGFLIGTVGAKILKSEPAHKAYVAVAKGGLSIKEGAETIVEEAKAEFDDVLAEAGYEKAED